MSNCRLWLNGCPFDRICHRVRGGIHPGLLTSLLQGESPVNLTTLTACLWTLAQVLYNSCLTEPWTRITWMIIERKSEVTSDSNPEERWNLNNNECKRLPLSSVYRRTAVTDYNLKETQRHLSVSAWALEMSLLHNFDTSDDKIEFLNNNKKKNDIFYWKYTFC